MATYQHQPLSENKREIRLLRFDNSRQPQIDPGDTIALCLEQVSLNDKPEYTALSYVWGDTTLTEPIRVNGYEFRVTGNLHALLQQLRVDTSVKRFWVDAICINQKDGDEKSWQVQQMKDTFQNAANVFIWLGPSSESSGQAMDQLKSIGATALKTKALQILEEPLGSRDAWRARLSRVLDRKQPEAFEEGTVESLVVQLDNCTTFRSAPMQAAIRSLLDRELWRRTWIVQEITMSQEAFIVCGDDRISVDTFDAALASIILCQESLYNVRIALSECFPLLEQSLLSLTALTHRRRRKVGRLPRLAALLMHQHRQAPERGFLFASDPRDIIFALLGIIGDADRLGLKAVYNKKSVEEVYTEATRAFVESCEWYRLEYCTFPKRMTGLPSWVPDWSKIAEQGTHCNPLSLWNLFSASLDKAQPPLSTSSDSKLLPRLGSRADVVTNIMEPPEWTYSDIAQSTRVKDRSAWLRAVEAFGCLHSPSRFQEEIWPTLVADIQRDHPGRPRRIDDRWREFSRTIFRNEENVTIGLTNEDITHFRASQPFFGQIWWKYPPANLSEEEKTLKAHAHHFLSWAEYINYGRTLFKTAEGRFGLGPQHMLAGDIVTIIHSTKVPIILRPVDQARYEFVGEAYVHGIMDREFMATNPPEEVFELV